MNLQTMQHATWWVNGEQKFNCHTHSNAT